MSKNPFFSVVIPLYNRAHIIEKTIASVLQQTCQDFEIIVVDDGSKDNPQPVIEAIGDARIRYIHQPNAGGSKARNTGIEASKGDYIAFLDSDDLFKQNKLEVFQYHIQKNDNCDVFFSFATVDRGNGIKGKKPTRSPYVNERIDEYLFCACQTIQSSTLVVSRQKTNKIRFNNNLKKGQDIDYVIELYSNSLVFYCIEQELSVWVDETSDDRVSHVNHSDVLEDWLKNNKYKISKKAYLGYRANILSFDNSSINLPLAIYDICCGLIFGGVTFKRSIHSFLRATIPSNAYRKLVNKYLKAGLE